MEMEVLGTMSGTSLDGVDAAVLRTDGRSILGFGDMRFRAYAEDERAAIRAALGRWPGEEGVEQAARTVEDAHAELCGAMGRGTVAFHGQTLAHAPRGRGTHQVGDGGALAERLGREVVWDFRSADVAAGGEGAPLAPAFHFACARWAGLRGAAFVNLGGVANLTWIAPGAEGPEEDGALLAFDTGPANALVDDLVSARTGARFDAEGALAARGTVSEQVVERFLVHPFFRRRPPKSLDRDDFSGLLADVRDLSDADAAATLTAASAASLAAGLRLCPARPERLLLTGGGRRNPVLVGMIAERSGIPAVPVEEIGLDGDMLEAQAFAFLAARVLRGLPTSFPGTTGVPHPVMGGRISRPSR